MTETDKDGTWQVETVKKGARTIKVRILTEPSQSYLDKLAAAPTPEIPAGVDFEKLKDVLLAKNVISDKSEVE